MTRDNEKIIWWYEKEGREFPWRETENPYKVLIAEAMLQKTSTPQVLPIYKYRKPTMIGKYTHESGGKAMENPSSQAPKLVEKTKKGFK